MFDTYMTSDGGPAAREALLAAPLWDRDWADGKSSRAMLDLIEWLRTRHRQGRLAGVIAFDADASSSVEDRERQMADRLLAVDPGRQGIVIVLTGSFHASKIITANRTPAPPAGALLPPDRTFSVLVQGNGGESWSCRANGCGVHDSAKQSPTTRRLRVGKTPDGRYDGILELGKPTTAAFPVK
jgi:hypothetical protein